MKKYKLLFCLIIFSPIFCFSGDLKVYYINVGQGDSIYISFPNGENMLIDGGPSSYENNAVIGFLRAKDIKKIDRVALSHPHSDHYYGLSPVFDMYPVDCYYDSFIGGSATANAFREKAKSKANSYITTTSLSHGTTVYSIVTTTPALYMVMLHNGDGVGGNNPNNWSLVFKIIYGSSTFIFGGDAESALEGWLVSNYGDSLQSDCYKVNHHGANTSSTTQFLEKLKPKYAFIQVGKNSYGHPSDEAISRISNWTGSTNIYRNDLDGTIFVKTSGDGQYVIQKGYIPVPDEEEQPPTDGEVPVSPPSIKSEFVMVEARDNIFNPSKGERVYLAYTMEEPGKIFVNIYTLFGELVKKHEYEETRTGLTVESTQNWSWDGKNENGQTVAPGVYLFHIQTPLKTAVKKVVVIR